MNIARVAFHASKSEASDWVDGLRGGKPEVAPADMKAAWRASLEALGIKVEE